MTAMRRISRQFPDYGWVWPQGEHDRLLRAVMLADDAAALALALAWLAANDINTASGRDHRLLAALAHRFGNRLAAAPAYPRLVGLQRLNWSRSRLTEAAAEEVLAALAARALPFVLIKGAARIAADPTVRRGRTAHDVDLLVAPADFGAAVDILVDMGWQPATGMSAARLRHRLPSIRALNFYKGAHGDIDLHQVGYHAHQANAEDDVALWRRARPAAFADVAALVPSAADEIALAIAHGSLDAHVHSDWLVDIDRVVRAGGVDWAVLRSVLRGRGLAVAAAAALSYLGLVIGTPIPAEVIADMVATADGAGWLGRTALFECKPRSDFTRLSAAARGLAKMARLWRSDAASAGEAIWRCRWLRPAKPAPAAAAFAATIALPPPTGQARALHLRLTLRVALPAARRRVEFDLRGDGRHILTLRFRKHWTAAGGWLLRFAGTVRVDGAIDALTLSASAVRHVRPGAPGDHMDRYGPVPFELVDVAVSELH